MRELSHLDNSDQETSSEPSLNASMTLLPQRPSRPSMIHKLPPSPGFTTYLQQSSNSKKNTKKKGRKKNYFQVYSRDPQTLPKVWKNTERLNMVFRLKPNKPPCTRDILFANYIGNNYNFPSHSRKIHKFQHHKNYNLPPYSKKNIKILAS